MQIRSKFKAPFATICSCQSTFKAYIKYKVEMLQQKVKVYFSPSKGAHTVLNKWPATLLNNTCSRSANVCQMTACWAHVHKILEGKWKRKKVKDRTFAPEGAIICNSTIMTYFHSSTGSRGREAESLMKWIYIFWTRCTICSQYAGR